MVNIWQVIGWWAAIATRVARLHQYEEVSYGYLSSSVDRVQPNDMGDWVRVGDLEDMFGCCSYKIRCGAESGDE